MNELISVIVPIYNVEKYLSRCIDSILNQTYKKIEVILVNDGSPDKCGEICERYAEKDKKIKVIHKKNGGLSDARNRGIDEAQGIYLTFIDSDDWIKDNYIEKLYSLLIKTSSDIAVCNFFKTSDEGEKIPRLKDEIREMSNIQALEEFGKGLYVQMVVAWGKLYKKELFDGIRFPVSKVHEDEFTTYKLLYKSKKIIYTSQQLLYYWQRPDSIMGKGFNPIHKIHSIQALEERVNFYNDLGLKELKDITSKELFYAYKGLHKNTNFFKDLENIEEIKTKHIKSRDILRNGKHNLRFKITYELYYCMLKLLRIIYPIYAKLVT